MINFKRSNVLAVAFSFFWITASCVASTSEDAIDSDRAEQLEQHLDEVKVRMNLSNKQVDEIRPILEESFEKRSAVLKKYGIDLQKKAGPSKKLGFRDARKLRGEMEGVRGDTLDLLEDILDEDQLDEFKLIQSELKTKMREKLKQRR